jgi:hypothetical protein
MNTAPRQKAAGFSYDDTLIQPVVKALNAGREKAVILKVFIR